MRSIVKSVSEKKQTVNIWPYIPVITPNNRPVTVPRPCKTPKKIRKIKIKIPYWLKKVFRYSNWYGINLNNIHEPSRGGIGIKLNMAKIILIWTIKENTISMPGTTVKKSEILIMRINNPKNSASAILVKGPAMETFSPPQAWSYNKRAAGNK